MELTLPLVTSPARGAVLKWEHLDLVKHKQMPYRSPLPPEWQKCAALNLPAEFQVAPREQPLHSTEFKASKFSLKIQPPPPPRAGFWPQSHGWTLLLCWQEITMLQHVLPAYRITARTWFVVKDITAYCMDSYEKHQKGLCFFIREYDLPFVHTIIFIFRDFHIARTVHLLWFVLKKQKFEKTRKICTWFLHVVAHNQDYRGLN